MEAAARHRLIAQLRADIQSLHAEIEALQVEIADFMQIGDIAAVDDRQAVAVVLQSRLTGCASTRSVRLTCAMPDPTGRIVYSTSRN